MNKKRLYLVHAQGRYGENCYVPLSVGCLWAYARTFPEITEAYEMVDFLYLKEPIERAIERLDAPDLIGIAHYIWNAEWNKAFARAVKKKWPNCIIIVGGIHVPDESPRILEENPDFDFAIYGEGEGAFADFLRAHAGTRPGLYYKDVGSLIFRTHAPNEFGIIVNPRHPFMPPAELRSPYLDGVFDALWPREKRWQVLQEFDRGCPYRCFAGDTLVALPDRILRFDDEPYGPSSLPCSDPRHVHRLGSEDDRIVAQGKRDCVRLGFENGLSLTVTPDHEVFTVIDEKIVDIRADALKPGDWLVVEVGQNAITDYVPLKAPSKTEAELLAEQGIGQGRRVPNCVKLPKLFDERVAWLTGHLIGDGCLPADDRAEVLFAVTDKTRVTLMSVVSDLFGIRLSLADSTFTDKMQHGTIRSRKVVQFLRESLGVQSGEAKLRVPRVVFHSPRNVVRAFLDGLWAADGYWPTEGESYLTTVSERLAVECAALIHWIGDAAVVRKIRIKRRPGSFTGSKPFCYRIEWHDEGCRTRVKGKPCVASRVPAIRHTYRDRDGELRLRQTPRNDRESEGSPREVLRHFEPEHPLLNRRFVFTRVSAVEPAGLQDTYDVHHHPTHKVAANGAYVRQCAMCAWGNATLDDLRLFPEERIRAELEWFGQHKVDYLDQADANFGIVKRDIELTKSLVEVKAKYGYPKTFRTSFAKNSNEVIWTIANLLHDAQMLKSVTLAMQSMDDNVLVQIRRKNIKFDKFGDLLKRYEERGIPTYTELILGLAGESLDTFLDGMERCMDAGQHSGLFCYLNISLPNTEQQDEKYIALHGLKTRSMPAMLTHGTPDDTVPREMQDIVIATAAMPHEDWLRAYLHMKTVEVFHAQGLLQDIAVALHARGMSYRDFYAKLLNWCLYRASTIAGEEIRGIHKLLLGVLDGGGLWDLIDPRLGDISWPPEEFAFARICLELPRFYQEIEPFLIETGATEEEIAAQANVIAPPWPDTVSWAREVVWYGRKGSAAKLKRNTPPTSGAKAEESADREGRAS